MPGPTVRTDIVEVYVFRRAGTASGTVSGGGGGARHAVEFLQLHRCKGAIANTWQPVMGHVENGETAAAAALRELAEETAYAKGRGLVAAWQLESVNTFFLAPLDAILHSPGFAVEVTPGIEPVLDDTHDGHRWITRDHADRAFLWPGQRRAVEEITRDILPADSPLSPLLRIDLDRPA